MVGLINIGAGLSEMGKGIAQFAGDAANMELKANLERQSLELSNKLQTERERTARIESGVPEQVAAARLGLAEKRAQIQATYDMLGLDIPKELADVLNTSSTATPTINRGVTTAPAPSVTGTAGVTGITSPVSVPLATGGAGAPMAAAVPGTNLVTTPGGGLTQAEKLPIQSGKTSVLSSMLPPGMSIQEARYMALTNPTGFASLVTEWQKPQHLRQGEVISVVRDGKVVPIYTAPNLDKGMVADESGRVSLMPGFIGALTSSESAKAQAQLPAELKKIGATGAQNRTTEEFKVNLQDNHELVDAFDPASQTYYRTTRGNALTAANGGLPLPAPGQETKLGAQLNGTFKMPDGSVIPAAPATTSKGPPGLATKPDILTEAEQKTWSDTLKSINDVVGPASQIEQRGLEMANILKAIQSGQYTALKADIGAKMKAWGINPDLIQRNLGDPAKVQELLKQNFAAALETMKNTSRFTEKELFAAQQNLANPNLEPEANLSIISQMVGLARQQQSMAFGWNSGKAREMGFQNPNQYVTMWMNQNPLQKFVDATHDEIGPLKGMQRTGHIEGKIYTDSLTKAQRLYQNGKFIPVPH